LVVGISTLIHSYPIRIAALQKEIKNGLLLQYIYISCREYGGDAGVELTKDLDTEPHCCCPCNTERKHILAAL
jgi:hypothetical protein